jgi:hypothetical protein
MGIRQFNLERVGAGVRIGKALMDYSRRLE